MYFSGFASIVDMLLFSYFTYVINVRAVLITGPLSSDPFDFTIPTLGDPEQSSVPIELVFEVTDSRLNISFEIIEDAILELSGEAPSLEHFVLVLSVPENPAVNQESGSIFNADVFIIDNEPGTKVKRLCNAYYKEHYTDS